MEKNKLLTPSQLTFILVGAMIGSSALTLPLAIIKDAQQDGWISCILGAVYPVYMVFIAYYMHKNFPKENILVLSKKYFGKVLGTILNVIFTLFFLLILTEAASGIADLLNIYMVFFLNRYKIIITLLLPAAFIAYKGIKSIGKMNEIIFYLTFPVFFIPIAALKDGLLLNVMPVFGSGIINIIKSTKESMLAYSGMEILFLIYPFFEDNKELKKCGLKSIAIIVIVYTWFAFSTIYYLGIDIIPKFTWPVVTVTEAVSIPIINNFRYIFTVSWTIIMIKILSNFYYSFTLGLNQLIKKISIKQFIIFMYPLIFYLSIKYENNIIRGDFLDKVIPIYVLFNLIYVSVVALLIHLKKSSS